MLVEVNTWLLIARRAIGGKLIEALFYVSWVGLRNIYYPYLIWAFYKEWQVRGHPPPCSACCSCRVGHRRPPPGAEAAAGGPRAQAACLPACLPLAPGRVRGCPRSTGRWR
jgi:hypothetical protein